MDFEKRLNMGRLEYEPEVKKLKQSRYRPVVAQRVPGS
jgi:hypothetical protein